MARLVLSDASPLIGLGRVDGLSWLRQLFGRVELTAEVCAELAPTAAPEPAIVRAVEEGWLVHRFAERGGLPRPPPHLGPGEWSTLVAAGAHRGPVLVLMDDRLARREARARGLTVAGTAAVVGMARSRGLIPSARDVFEALLRSDFRLSREVIRQVLERVEPEAESP